MEGFLQRCSLAGSRNFLLSLWMSQRAQSHTLAMLMRLMCVVTVFFRFPKSLPSKVAALGYQAHGVIIMPYVGLKTSLMCFHVNFRRQENVPSWGSHNRCVGEEHIKALIPD